MHFVLRQFDGIIEHTGDALLDEGAGGGHHLFEAIATGAADDLKAKMISALGGEF